MRRSFTLLAALALAATAGAQTYRLIDLGVPPGQQVIAAAAMNNSDHVAASSENFAFRFAGGTWQNLGTLPGGTLSSAAAINSLGQVAGSSQFTGSGSLQHAAILDSNMVTDLGTLPDYGNDSRARGINTARQVVGRVGTSGGSTSSRAFIWDEANGMRLITPGLAQANSINDAGQVTGNFAPPGVGTGVRHAFLWTEAGGVQDLGTLVPSDGNPFHETSSEGVFVNANGHVAGNSAINYFDNRQHAVLYDGTALRDLGSLGPDAFESDRSTAFGVNNRDEVVGSSYRPFDGGALYQVAFIYRHGAMYDLERLLDASGSDYRLYSAVAINDYGHILVDAIKRSTGERRAVILQPNPIATDFAIVVDNSDPANTAFGTGPTINDRGSVAFYVEAGTSTPGVYRKDPGAPPVFVADANNGFPAIDNLGEVISRRTGTGLGPTEIFKGTSAATLAIVAQAFSSGPDGTFRLFGGYPNVGNDTGTVVFYAELNPLNPRRRGIYTGDGTGSTRLVADNTGSFTYFGNDPAINNAGTVAFIGTLSTTENGIFVGRDGGANAATRVVSDPGSGLYAFESLALNNHGQIVFLARRQATGAKAIYTVREDGSGLRLLADAAGPFGLLKPPAINDLGTILFYATLDNNAAGLYAGPDPVDDKVLEVGDPLFDSTVTSLAFFRGLNNRNEFAFYYELANGRKGIAQGRLTLASTPTNVVSRRTHGSAGTFDLPLATSGQPTVEPRNGQGSYRITFHFPVPVSFGAATVTSASGQTAEVADTRASNAEGTEISVDLANVSNGQVLTTTLQGVEGRADVAVRLAILPGDVNGDGIVNAGDVIPVRNRSGQVTDVSNFLADVTTDGVINGADTLVVRGRAGSALSRNQNGAARETRGAVR